MILFKHPEHQRELSKVKRRLRVILEAFSKMAWEEYGDDVVITSIYRDQDGSTHKYWRGIDLAILVYGGIVGTEKIRGKINDDFPYGDGVHDTIPLLGHGTAPHVHIQCK